MSITSNQPVKKRVSGVILIDKPQGLTSQQVVSKVKYLFKSPHHDSKKAGHTGTLDPMATGLLPVCLGEATKFSHYQLEANKSYEAIIQLGGQTDTGDAEGQVIRSATVPTVTEADLLRVTQQFLGQQLQIPPMYSALKKDGKKLYEYAREGIEIDRSARPINIRQLQLILMTNDTLKLTVTCSKGTYVRVIGEDIAQALGTLGYLTSLRRSRVGEFYLEDAISLESLENMSLEQRFSHLLPVDACINHIPTLVLNDDQWQRVLVGQRLNVFNQISPQVLAYLNDQDSSLMVTNSSEDNVLEEYVSGTNRGDDQPNSSRMLVSVYQDNQSQDKEVTKDIRLISEKGVFIGLAELGLSGRLQPKKILPVN
ncbi:MAG: tRNA pseudouridine(55) synthase TruB [Psychrobacter sp.]|nr:tRNA pseudouridine(55) synthase TruB [Psychrobacter sp.]